MFAGFMAVSLFMGTRLCVNDMKNLFCHYLNYVKDEAHLHKNYKFDSYWKTSLRVCNKAGVGNLWHWRAALNFQLHNAGY
jgi:hypothetical protein